MDRARFEQLMVAPTASIRMAIAQVDAGAIEIALVVDEQRRLLGTVTDGDVRRALLAGAELDDPIVPIVHRDPVTAAAGTDVRTLLGLMRSRDVDQVPLLEDSRVTDIAFLRDLLNTANVLAGGDPDDPPVPSDDSLALPDHPVVLMAGGLGERLRPLTEQTPKPMLQVGGRPLLETVLEQVREAGFSRVLIAVNYRAQAIEEHFGDGSSLGMDIAYLREDRPLGSAGALRLAGTELDRPFVVMNADLLTSVKLGALMRFHHEERNLVTVGVRRYVLDVPYGVVELDGTRLAKLSEKPRMSFFVNAGLYAVDPGAVSLMPGLPERFDMTDLVEAALRAQARVGGFPVREYWLDVGQLADYDRAEQDHATYFAVGR
jgi:dTDP-glucose pyrophosphorylase